MALADDIRTLRDRVLAELNAAHDYYEETKTAWDIVLSSFRRVTISPSETRPPGP